MTYSLAMYKLFITAMQYSDKIVSYRKPVIQSHFCVCCVQTPQRNKIIVELFSFITIFNELKTNTHQIIKIFITIFIEYTIKLIFLQCLLDRHLK